VNLSFNFQDNLLVYRKYEIVNKVNNSETEILFNDPVLKKGEIKNNFFFLPLDIENFSFSTSQQICKELYKEVQEIQKEKQFQNLQEQKEQIIKGKISHFSNNICFIDLGSNLIGH